MKNSPHFVTGTLFRFSVFRSSAVLWAALLLIEGARGQDETNALWQEEAGMATGKDSRQAGAGDAGTVFGANTPLLGTTLASAPSEGEGVGVTIALPLPGGGFRAFEIFETAIMAPELAARFPEIRTYGGTATDGSGATVVLDLTPHGLHAQILDGAETYYLDPLTPGDTEHSVAYRKSDVMPPAEERHCHARRGLGRLGWNAKASAGEAPKDPAPPAARPSSGTQLRTYRLAVATTGEYTQFHGGTASLGLAAVVTAVNRVTGIYQTELSIRFQLVPNNNLLIYTNGATDPYTNNNADALLDQNQVNIDTRIGNANYDIGHVFSTGGGGLATFGVVGITGFKAMGETGLPSPTGDAFWVDYVAHEIGHQFGADHTFNGDSGACAGTRESPSAYEPGSGTTIMGYAGLCGNDDLQAMGTPFFHSRSFDQITDFVDLDIPTVGTRTATGNAIPMVEAGRNFTIPARTPFVLTATGSDANGDSLTYCWEERDLGSQADLGAADDGFIPLFRTFPPVADPSRTFPRIEDLIGNTPLASEKLPTTTRFLRFRVTARDGRAAGGGVSWDDRTLNVVDTGAPFRVTSPNTATAWPKGSLRTVTWDVAGTTASGINASSVDISLSTDGGLTYPFVLATAVPNDGSQAITVPGVAPTMMARVRVQATGGVFFDVSDANFPILGSAGFVLAATPAYQEVCAPASAFFSLATSAFGSFANPVTLSATGLPLGTTVTFAPNPVTPGGSSLMTVAGTSSAPAARSTITVTGSSGATSSLAVVDLRISKTAPTAIILTGPATASTNLSTRPNFTWNNSVGAAFYDVEVSENDATFSAPFSTSTTLLSTNVFTLKPGTRYYWRVRATNACGSNVSLVRFFNTLPNFQSACSTTRMAIPDANPTGITSTLSVASGGTITDLDVSVNITHSFVGDLDVILTHVETGASVALVVFLPCGGNDIEVVFDDEAAPSATQSCGDATPALPRGMHFRPNSSLSVFDGQDIGGTWILRVADFAPDDIGTLNGWCLLPTIEPVVNPFERWRRANFTTAQLANAAISGPTADPEHDGRTNVFEYFFGCAPLIPDVLHDGPGLATDFNGLPSGFRYSRNALRYDALDCPEFSSDLGTWMALPRSVSSSGVDSQVFESPLGSLPADAGYTRLKVKLR